MIRVIEGKGRTEDRSLVLLEAIVAAVNEAGKGLSVAAVIGCLDLAKDVIKAEEAEYE
jgi:hypothetical protein